ncbi:hypothetical protein QQ045_000401 [Rhodiola kirilowii]
MDEQRMRSLQMKDEVYVKFHDESWGVPAYEDRQEPNFFLLSMSAMLMDYNWTEILKRKLLREVFSGFDPNKVAKMEENLILETVSNKAPTLPESRIRCIVDNAKCILLASDDLKYIWKCSTRTYHFNGYL